jgi:hypothetical protein
MRGVLCCLPCCSKVMVSWMIQVDLLVNTPELCETIKPKENPVRVAYRTAFSETIEGLAASLALPVPFGTFWSVSCNSFPEGHLKRIRSIVRSGQGVGQCCPFPYQFGPGLAHLPPRVCFRGIPVCGHAYMHYAVARKQDRGFRKYCVGWWGLPLLFSGGH